MAQEVIHGTTVNHEMDFSIFDFHRQEQEWHGAHGLSIIGSMVQVFRFRVQIEFRFRFRFRIGIRLDHMDFQF